MALPGEPTTMETIAPADWLIQTKLHAPRPAPPPAP
jgi:hypothetical protein